MIVSICLVLNGERDVQRPFHSEVVHRHEADPGIVLSRVPVKKGEHLAADVRRVQPRDAGEFRQLAVHQPGSVRGEHLAVTLQLYVSDAVTGLPVIPLAVKRQTDLHRLVGCDAFLQVPGREREVVCLPHFQTVVAAGKGARQQSQRASHDECSCFHCFLFLKD